TKVLDEATTRGHLAAHDAKSNVRFRLLIDAVGTIGRKLDTLSRVRATTNYASFFVYEEKLKRQLEQYHRDITPASADGVLRIHTDNIYVQPTIVRHGA